MRPVGPLVAGVALLALAACSGSSSDGAGADPTPSGTTATPAEIDPTTPACGFLTAADRAALAGAAVDQVIATSRRTGGSQCRWQSDTSLIEVTTLPATAWAKTLPQTVQQLKSSADLSTAEDKAQLARAEKLLADAATFTGDQACAAFTTIAEIGGAKKGARTTVSYLPITETQTGVSAQTCSDGELTSVVFSQPGLVESAKVSAAATKAVAAAQKRAVAK